MEPRLGALWPGTPTPGSALTCIGLWLVPDVDVVNSEYLFPVTLPAHLLYSSLTCGAQGARLGKGQAPGAGAPCTPPTEAAAHLLVEQAVEHKEEEALQAVEDGEGVGQQRALRVKEEEAEDPGAAQHKELSHSRDGQHPAERTGLQLGRPHLTHRPFPASPLPAPALTWPSLVSSCLG